MNKFFAFLCVNSMVFNIHTDDSQDTPSRGVDFGSWYKLAQTDDEERERSAENNSKDHDDSEEEDNE